MTSVSIVVPVYNEAESLRELVRQVDEVAERLTVQVADAAKWSDHILEYFQTFSQRPILPR